MKYFLLVLLLSLTSGCYESQYKSPLDTNLTKYSGKVIDSVKHENGELKIVFTDGNVLYIHSGKYRLSLFETKQSSAIQIYGRK